ncbi:MAG: YifB family Mg chelatase-like AAA ATPase [Puniceicoccales bacterium]|jgi:magnesium chelatase family protein|nr:YifB family Mg chelatase-like AAA ATPase [Puniceicoccales bacterium]
MLAIIQSGAILGIDALPINIEINSGEAGEPRFVLVGLPDAAVKESQGRVYSALANSGFCPPKTRTTANLSPGNIKKEGPLYDLPIALGIIASMNQAVFHSLDKFLIAGELSLSGRTLPVRGAISLGILAKKLGKSIILPEASAEEASLLNDVSVVGVKSLDHAVQFLTGMINIEPKQSNIHEAFGKNMREQNIDFSDVKGQFALRRAVEVAVAGGHNMMMIGSPGSGKSMVAKRIPSIMPDPTISEFLENLRIESLTDVDSLLQQRIFCRPFRSPHHTISDIGLLGGGKIPMPGEISLAHNGVLFLDELPEFKRSTLEVLRQPLEDGTVSISRSAGKITFPCEFMLVAAMNPCPCGHFGNPKVICHCSADRIQKYRSRISGPLLDRIDIHINVKAVQANELVYDMPSESSESIKKRIEAARSVQQERYKGKIINARASNGEMKKYCEMDTNCTKLLESAMAQFSFSARAHSRIIKVARTIADLNLSTKIKEEHLLEAIQYRSLDRN